jgi:hypothetical protein
MAVACSSTQDFRTAPPGALGGDPPAKDPSASLPVDPGPPPAPAVVVLASDQGLAADYPDSQGPFEIVTDENWVYWLDAWSHLARVPKGGGKVEDLADTEASPHLLVLSGDYLYFTNVPQRRIERIRKDGGAIEAVTPASTDQWRTVQRFVVDGPRITWIDAQRLLRCETMPCTASTEIAIGTDLHPSGLATFGEHIFVPYLETDPQFPNQMQPGGITVPREGGQVSTLPLAYHDVLGDVEPTDARRTSIYAASDHMIVRAAWPGADPPKVLVSGDEADAYPYAIQLGGPYIYWLNRGASLVSSKLLTTGSIMRVKKDGSEKPEKVYAADDMLHGLRVGKDALYVSTNGGRVLKIPRPADGPLP